MQDIMIDDEKSNMARRNYSYIITYSQQPSINQVKGASLFVSGSRGEVFFSAWVWVLLEETVTA